MRWAAFSEEIPQPRGQNPRTYVLQTNQADARDADTAKQLGAERLWQNLRRTSDPPGNSQDPPINNASNHRDSHCSPACKWPVRAGGWSLRSILAWTLEKSMSLFTAPCFCRLGRTYSVETFVPVNRHLAY